MENKVTAASAIKAVQDLVSSFTKEDWESLQRLSFLEFHGMVKYDAEGGNEGGIENKNKSTGHYSCRERGGC
jgi:hypothetical protein